MLAADGADGAFEAADACFAGVVTDHVAQGFVWEFDLLGGDSVFFHLTRNQIAARDVKFFFFAVALELDDFHAVAQRLGYGVEHVRGRDEKNFRQVERDV